MAGRFWCLTLLTVIAFIGIATSEDGESNRRVIVVCRGGTGKCQNAKDISTLNLKSDNVYTRDQKGQMQRANTLRIVSRNFTKNCKYSKKDGRYHCDTKAMKGSASCKNTKKGVVCMSGTEDHSSVQVRCWKVSGKHVTCSHDIVCAYSHKL